MNIRSAVILLASLAFVGCASETTSNGTTSEAAATSQSRSSVKLFLENHGTRSIVLHDAAERPISGGTAPGHVSTFDPLAVGKYVVKNDQAATVGSFVLARSGGPEETWVCTDAGCSQKKAAPVDPLPPEAPTSLEVTVLFAQSGHKLFVHPDLDHPERTVSSEAGQAPRHVLPAGKAIGIDAWSLTKPGEQTGDWRELIVPADARFAGGTLSCSLSVDRSLDCTLASQDGKLVTKGDGTIGAPVRP